MIDLNLMPTDAKVRIKHLLEQIKNICDNLLKNIFTIGNDVNTKSIISYTYSPNTDIIYIYIKDHYSGSLLLHELSTLLSKDNGVDMKSIDKDIVNDMFIIELEFGNKFIIADNLKQEVSIKSIDNRYL